MYIRTSDNTLHTESSIRAAFPNTSFSAKFVPPEGYAWVFPAPQPTHDTLTQGVREITPVLSNGKYEQAWEIFALDAETIAANQAAESQRIKDEIMFNAQKRLDTFAQTRYYDGILSACTYANSSVPKYAAEGAYCLQMRDQTWATLLTILQDVEAGNRPAPSGYADIEAELPVLTWPN